LGEDFTVEVDVRLYFTYVRYKTVENNIRF